ncbi:cation:proton antiporter [Candidatus Woesearchaeota archaeon]|nr:cation:proton antiporter [Candidatus Woesearchaeota archaeon]
MAAVLIFLTYLSIILLIGLIVSIISQKFKVPNILLLLLIGISVGRVNYNGKPLIYFPELFLTSISIMALVMIVFDSASRFKLRNFDYFSLHTLWLSLVFIIFNLIFLSFFTMIIFDVNSIFLAFMFAALMSGTDPAAVLSMLKDVNHKVFDFLKLEALLNTPLVVLIPFLILDLKTTLKDQILITTFIEQFIPILQQFIVGIGSGVLIGLIMFKFMKKQYSVVLSPLAVITAALLTYTIAENLQGNGVLAVTTMGILFGNVYVKQKFQIQEFSSIFSSALEILVFVLIGLIVAIPFSLEFFIKSLLLFVLYLGIRFLAIVFSLRGMNFNFKEKVFMSLNTQKGIAVAVVVFSLANLNILGMETILNLTLTFMLYSIILSAFVLRLSDYFIKGETQK